MQSPDEEEGDKEEVRLFCRIESKAGLQERESQFTPARVSPEEARTLLHHCDAAIIGKSMASAQQRQQTHAARSAAFSLLNVLVKVLFSFSAAKSMSLQRRLCKLEELDDLMETLKKLCITSDDDVIRQRCRAAVLNYVRHYQTHALADGQREAERREKVCFDFVMLFDLFTLQSQKKSSKRPTVMPQRCDSVAMLQFFSTQLKYSEISGQQSALEMLSGLCNALPQVSMLKSGGEEKSSRTVCAVAASDLSGNACGALHSTA